MELKGVHFLLTYRCDSECDHCFVWGSPKSKGTFTLERVRNILAEAKKLETVTYISLEGGEAFLYYPIMVKAVREAAALGFQVEVLSNCYWATCPEDALEWLRPIAETGDARLSLSSDLYHGDRWMSDELRNALKAAKALNMKASVLTVKRPDAETPCPDEAEGAKVSLGGLMYRGRAAQRLAQEADKKPWQEFNKCPYENLANPGRVHVDPFGYVHICQGLSIGNAWKKPFSKTMREYRPFDSPVLEPLMRGGPVALVERFSLPHDESYADACHLCYAARCILREKYPEELAPDQMYGEFT